MEIKNGSILSFLTIRGDYGYARVLSRIEGGHFIEVLPFFDETGKNPNVEAERFFHPQLLNTYSTLVCDEGEWRIVYIPDEEYVCPDAHSIVFTFGAKGDEKYQNILGDYVIPESGKRYPSQIIKDDALVNEIVEFWSCLLYTSPSPRDA